jgi:hypothetical protein
MAAIVRFLMFVPAEIDQDIDPRQLPAGFVEQLPDTRAVDDIDGMRQQTRFARPSGSRLAQTLDTASSDHGLTTFRGQRQGDSPSNARSPADHHRCFTFKFHHVVASILKKLDGHFLSICMLRIGKEITERNGASHRFLSGRKTGG